MTDIEILRTARGLGRYAYRSRYSLAEAYRYAQSCDWHGVQWTADMGRAVMEGWTAERAELYAG